VTYPVQPVKPTTSTELPVGKLGEWSYEPKFDGFRCVAFACGGRVRLQSRQQRGLTRYFPEVAAAVGALDVDVVLDGELVVWRHGRLDFVALQQRIHPAESRADALARSMPASYVVFDLLEVTGTDLRRRPYLERRTCLEYLVSRQLPHGLVMMPASDDPAVAEQWLINHGAAGIEGVVAKRCRQSYRPGKTKWHKVARGSRPKPSSAASSARSGSPRRSWSAYRTSRAGCGSLGAPRRCRCRCVTSCPNFLSPQAGRTHGPR
jgi:ATP-dependent DNA ligase